jgi:hypothetical protein
MIPSHRKEQDANGLEGRFMFSKASGVFLRFAASLKYIDQLLFADLA